MRLTQKESKFVEAYLTATSIKEAAHSAGYLTNLSSQGCRVLNRPRVQEAIQAERERLSVTHRLTPDVLAENLLRAYERADKARDVIGMVRAVRELGLLCGLYPNNKRI